MMKKVDPTRKPIPFHHWPFFQSTPNHLMTAMMVDEGQREGEWGMIQPLEDKPVVKDGIGDVLGRTLLSARVVRVLPPPMLPPAVVAAVPGSVHVHIHSSPS
jgi:hypothetical protein